MMPHDITGLERVKRERERDLSSKPMSSNTSAAWVMWPIAQSLGFNLLECVYINGVMDHGSLKHKVRNILGCYQ
jgi:hypothetical protein